jgi:hypothetical protein
MGALQIHLFLTNKANFLDDQINVSTFITMNYEQPTMNYEIKNKPNSNPIQSQYKPNSKPIQTQYKPKQSQFQERILFDDYSFILYTGVLYKNKPNMEIQQWLL